MPNSRQYVLNPGMPQWWETLGSDSDLLQPAVQTYERERQQQSSYSVDDEGYGLVAAEEQGTVALLESFKRATASQDDGAPWYMDWFSGPDDAAMTMVGELRSRLNLTSDEEVTAAATMMGKAASAALAAYGKLGPSREQARAAAAAARKALRRFSPLCPECHNVLALAANSLKLALEEYDTALWQSRFLPAPALRDHWAYHPRRAMVRALLGRASTLRKLERWEEAWVAYQSLEAITDSWPAHTSYINWRWHVPAVLLALGDCDEALAYMHRVADKFRDRDGDAKAFSFAATATAFKWHKALAEFCLVSRKGGKPTFNRMSDFDGELATGELTLTPSLVDPTGDYSTLTGAFDLNPHVMECLAAGETRLPRLPMLPSMGLMQSVEQALVYCNGASKLWRSIPGALEWALGNINTYLAAEYSFATSSPAGCYGKMSFADQQWRNFPDLCNEAAFAALLSASAGVHYQAFHALAPSGGIEDCGSGVSLGQPPGTAAAAVVKGRRCAEQLWDRQYISLYDRLDPAVRSQFKMSASAYRKRRKRFEQAQKSMETETTKEGGRRVGWGEF